MTDERTMRERMLAGDPYIADDPVLAEESRRAQQLTHRLNTADPTDHELRRALLTDLLGAFEEGGEGGGIFPGEVFDEDLVDVAAPGVFHRVLLEARAAQLPARAAGRTNRIEFAQRAGAGSPPHIRLRCRFVVRDVFG